MHYLYICVNKDWSVISWWITLFNQFNCNICGVWRFVLVTEYVATEYIENWKANLWNVDVEKYDFVNICILNLKVLVANSKQSRW